MPATEQWRGDTGARGPDTGELGYRQEARVTRSKVNTTTFMATVA